MRIRGGRERRLRFAIRLGNRQVSEPAGLRASARRSAAPKRDTWLAHKDGGCGGPRGAKPPPGARSARLSERVGPCRDGQHSRFAPLEPRPTSRKLDATDKPTQLVVSLDRKSVV